MRWGIKRGALAMFGGWLGRSDVEGLSGMGGIGLLVGVVGLVIDLSVTEKRWIKWCQRRICIGM